MNSKKNSCRGNYMRKYGNHLITVCNCNSNGPTNEVCDKLDGSCICSNGHHGKLCQFGESCKKLCQLPIKVRENLSWDDLG